MTNKISTAILISGRGSNMLALAEAAQAQAFPAQIDLVLSNRPDAAGLGKAKALGITTATLDHTLFKNRQAFEQALDDLLRLHDIELVCLAGFMRVLTPWFTQRWAGRVINIHPSLLPKYKGLHTHARALEAGDAEHGCTVHWVTAELDGGAIIAQETMPILADDTPDSLAMRLIDIEHTLYPKAFKLVASQLLSEKAAQ